MRWIVIFQPLTSKIATFIPKHPVTKPLSVLVGLRVQSNFMEHLGCTRHTGKMPTKKHEKRWNMETQTIYKPSRNHLCCLFSQRASSRYLGIPSACWRSPARSDWRNSQHNEDGAVSLTQIAFLGTEMERFISCYLFTILEAKMCHPQNRTFKEKGYLSSCDMSARRSEVQKVFQAPPQPWLVS